MLMNSRAYGGKNTNCDYRTVITNLNMKCSGAYRSKTIKEQPNTWKLKDPKNTAERWRKSRKKT